MTPNLLAALLNFVGLVFLIAVAKKLLHILFVSKKKLGELESEQSGINTVHGMSGDQTGAVYNDKRVNTEAVRGL